MDIQLASGKHPGVARCIVDAMIAAWHAVTSSVGDVVRCFHRGGYH
jgi:hypothetical protein